MQAWGHIWSTHFEEHMRMTTSTTCRRNKEAVVSFVDIYKRSTDNVRELFFRSKPKNGFVRWINQKIVECAPKKFFLNLDHIKKMCILKTKVCKKRIKLVVKMWQVWSEALARSCSVKKVFLEISQNSQENTCVRVSYLIKLQA